MPVEQDQVAVCVSSLQRSSLSASAWRLTPKYSAITPTISSSRALVRYLNQKKGLLETMSVKSFSLTFSNFSALKIISFSNSSHYQKIRRFHYFNHSSTTMIVFASLQNFVPYYKSLTPSKSIPQKSNNNFEKKYPYVTAGTLEPMRLKNILTKNCPVSAF